MQTKSGESRCDKCGKNCSTTSYNRSVVDMLANDQFEAMLSLGLTCEEVFDN